MSRLYRACLIWALFVLPACTRSHVNGGARGKEELETAGAHGAGMGGAAPSPVSMLNGGASGASTPLDAGSAAMPPITAGTGPAPTVTERAAAEVAAALARGPVVWIGQLRADRPATCKPETGGPYPSGVNVQYTGDHFERVVIVAQGDPSTGALAVRATFGEGAVPASPADLPPLAADDPFWICYFQFPTAGFEYTGLDPVLSNERLRFAVSSNELWHPWCESREFGCDGPCETFPACYCGDDPCEPRFPYQIELCKSTVEEKCACANGSCWADLRHRFSVDLVVTPEGLEGVSNVGEMRLRRVEQ